jgi:MFS family permease
LLILALSAVVLLRFGAWGVLTTFFNVYLDDSLLVSTALIGGLVAAAQLVAVPAALAAPLVVGRWGIVRTIMLGSLAMGLTILPVALIPQWWAAGLGYLGTSIAYYLTTGPIRVFSQEIVAPAWRGTMSGALGLGAGLSMSAVSLGGGYAIIAFGYPSVFLVGTVLALVGALCFRAYFREPRGELVA